jgi:hypothetical protein
MTPRERKDLPWIMAAFAFVTAIVVAGFVGWH